MLLALCLLSLVSIPALGYGPERDGREPYNPRVPHAPIDPPRLPSGPPHIPRPPQIPHVDLDKHNDRTQPLKKDPLPLPRIDSMNVDKSGDLKGKAQQALREGESKAQSFAEKAK